MQFDELRPVLIDILTLPEFSGEYLSLNQICEQIEKRYPQLWKTLTESQLKIKSNSGMVYNYSDKKTSDFIENALKYYSMNNGIPNLEAKVIQCFKKNLIQIYRIKQD